jgi:F0F1-type ATP synthase epsilon subunit
MPENPKKLEVSIRSALQSYFKDKAQTVTSYNDTGMFDILPQHANFVSIIKDRIIIDKGMQTQKEFKIERGVLSVRKDRVDVYLGFALGADKEESQGTRGKGQGSKSQKAREVKEAKEVKEVKEVKAQPDTKNPS